MDDTRTRLPGLDGLRGLSALGIVGLHVSLYTARARPPWDLGDGLLQGLRLGVVLFFVISGFVLVRPWLAAARGARDQPRTGPYLLRRAARVLPAYYASLGLAALVLVGSGSDRMARPADLPALALLKQNWFAAVDGKLVPPAWTLGVEASFYLVLPLLGMALIRVWTTLPRRLVACAGVVLACVSFNGAVVLWLPAQWHRTLPAYGYAFALGAAAAAILAERRPARPTRVALLAGGWSLVLLDALAHVPWELPARDVWCDLPAAFGCAAIVAAVAGGRAGALATPPLRWLGGRSYALFLTHYPVILLLGSRGDLPRTPGVAIAVVLLWSLAASEALTRTVERPAMRLARRLSNGDRSPRHRRPRGAILNLDSTR